MRIKIQATTLLASLLLVSAPGAGDETAPPASASSSPQTEGTKDWRQIEFQPEPALREQIDRTKAFLDDKGAEVDEQVSRLKTEGLIDRRSTTRIRSALDDARGSMTGMSEGMQSDDPVDGWTARMIAYELGMAADTLVQQADKIETELASAAADHESPQGGDSASQDQRRSLIATLRETSTLLRKAARAIAGNVE